METAVLNVAVTFGEIIIAVVLFVIVGAMLFAGVHVIATFFAYVLPRAMLRFMRDYRTGEMPLRALVDEMISPPIEQEALPPNKTTNNSTNSAIVMRR